MDAFTGYFDSGIISLAADEIESPTLPKPFSGYFGYFLTASTKKNGAGTNSLVRNKS